jgi:geranylgeranylglycerol-phosphate geranylgeranyltransferase
MPSLPSERRALGPPAAVAAAWPAAIRQVVDLRTPASRPWPLLACLRVTRPPDNAFALIGTLLGAGLAGAHQPLHVVVSVAISNALLSAASMTFNDWHDVAEDAVNRPDRAIPSGVLHRAHALVLAFALFAAGVSVAALASTTFALAAVAITIGSLLYTAKLKSIPFAGNVTVALLSAYPLWCWLAVEGRHSRAYVGAAAGFFMAGIGREIIRTAADAAGDRARGIATVATIFGGRMANRVGLLLMLTALAGASLLARGLAGPAYVSALLVAAAVTLVMGGYHAFDRSAPRASRRLTMLARTMTGLLALGVAWDLVARGLAPR